MLAWGGLDARGYSISKLDFESESYNLRLHQTAGQKGKLARRTVRLSISWEHFAVARGLAQIIVNFFLAFPSRPSLARCVCGEFYSLWKGSNLWSMFMDLMQTSSCDIFGGFPSML